MIVFRKKRFNWGVVSLFLFVFVALFSTASFEQAYSLENDINLFQPEGVTTSANYIIRLNESPIATYRGEIRGFKATSPRVTGANRLDINSADSIAYQNHLIFRQSIVEGNIRNQLSRHPVMSASFQHAFNGFVMELTPSEAARVAALPGVAAVYRETFQQLQTDAGPDWIGAPSIWDGTSSGVASLGEGVVVGILDTGINSDHPSFADVGGDGYNHTNPLGSGNYLPGSYCDITNPGFCNDKLIGAWSFVSEATTPEDSDGHGSHTASTVAGNRHTATIGGETAISDTQEISGVAPHANIIAYDVCVTTCPGAALVSAANQIVIDSGNLPNGLAAVNYSISGGEDPYNDAVEIAFLAAADAGIFVSASAGNSGPGADTVAHRSPWVMTVGASTHDRAYVSSIINMTSDGASLPDIQGSSFSSGHGPAMIVDAADFGDSGCLSPFAANTWTNGEIVVCDRGTIARTEKGSNVLAGGAGGMILANTSAEGSSISADVHFLPAVHITFDDSVVLRDWMNNNSNPMGTITTSSADISDSNGDIMADFSSRGPNTTFDVIKPDITAPGVSIWAAIHDGGSSLAPEYGFLSGTSMSSPHSAGAGALIAAVQPGWSPIEIKSALMMTSIVDVLKEDGATSADPFDFGAGRIDLTAAALAGLVMDETTTNFENADPALGGDPKTLNIPSMMNSNCIGLCSWTRTVESTLATDVTWNVTAVDPTGSTIDVTPSSFTIPAGGTQELTINLTVDSDSNGDFVFGRVILTAAGGEAPDAHMPVAVITTDTAGGVPFTAVADAFVGARRPNDNRGSISILRIDGNPETNTYLRFDVAGTGGNVSEATLRIFVDNNGAGTGFDVQAISDNGWGEGSITYNNAPALGSVLGSSDSISDGVWAEIDVTPHVTGDGLVSFALTTGSPSLISVSSREGANPPQLLVETDGTPPPDPVLTINTIGNGSVSTDVAPPYSEGQQVTLTATPDAGWLFDGWTGDITSSDNPLVVTMNGDVTVTANFIEDIPPPAPELTILTVGNGSVSTDAAPPYSEGQQVTLTATAGAGWLFDGWTGDITSSDNPLVVTMNGDVTVTASFVEDVPPPAPELTINTVGNGSVSTDVAPPYSESQQVTLTATPDAGWLFDGWTGDITSSDNPLVVTMNGDVTVTANFIEDVPPPAPELTINIVGNGSVLTDVAPPYSEGQQVTLTATPDAGWLFDGWTGDVTSSSNPLVITMNGDVTVTANFVEDVPPPAGEVQVGDLDGVDNRVARQWEAIVTILVVDDNGAPVANATVDGSWNVGDNASSSCTTDSNGTCTVTQTGLTRQNSTVTFTVDNITHASLTYNSGDNSDPDGDSDGTSIIVDRP
ncbi:MAG: S8 family serine peptidase [Chloroflexota bacterium]